MPPYFFNEKILFKNDGSIIIVIIKLYRSTRVQTVEIVVNPLIGASATSQEF